MSNQSRKARRLGSLLDKLTAALAAWARDRVDGPWPFRALRKTRQCKPTGRVTQSMQTRLPDSFVLRKLDTCENAPMGLPSAPIAGPEVDRLVL